MSLARLLAASIVGSATAQYQTEYSVLNTTTTPVETWRHQYSAAGTQLQFSSALLDGWSDIPSTTDEGRGDLSIQAFTSAVKWYPGDNAKAEQDFLTKTALTCSSCNDGIKTLNFFEGNRFGHAKDVVGGAIKSFMCKLDDDSDCKTDYHAEPRKLKIDGTTNSDYTSTNHTSCVKDYCDAKTDCGKTDSGPSAGNTCRNPYKFYSNGHQVSRDGNKCDCGRANQDEAANCKQCKTGYTNYPYCNHQQSSWTSSNLCSSKGTANANYFLANSVNKDTSCGPHQCAPTQKCCSGAQKGYYGSGRKPWADGRSQWNEAVAATDEASYRCVESHKVCCGASVCDFGTKCLNADLGICATVAESRYITDGYTACWGGDASKDGAKLANGTYVKGNLAKPSSWCAPWETCCQGQCCGSGSECVDRGDKKPSAATFSQKSTSPTNTFGWDPMYDQQSEDRPASGDQYCTATTGAKQPWNPAIGMQVVTIPLLLTLAYVLGILLTAKSGAPAPIKILSMVSFFLCILNAYHYTWRITVFISVIVFFTTSATGSGSKSAWVGVLLLLAQLFLLGMFFSITDFFGNAEPDNTRSRTNLTPHTAPLGPNSLSTWVQLCTYEYDFFQHDTLGRDWDYDKGANGSLYMFFGYCDAGWLVTMRFFLTLQGVVLVALSFFTSQHLFAGAATNSNKVSAEVEAP